MPFYRAQVLYPGNNVIRLAQDDSQPYLSRYMVLNNP
jgi:hypothetical protein